MAHNKTSSSLQKVCLAFEIPVQDDLEKFVKTAGLEAQKAARTLWREKRLGPIKKSGRPSLKTKIFQACDEVWKEWGETFPKNKQSHRNLLAAVQRRLSLDPTSRAAERHVQKWIANNLSPLILPRPLANHLKDIDWILNSLSLYLRIQVKLAIAQHTSPSQKLRNTNSQVILSKIFKKIVLSNPDVRRVCHAIKRFREIKKNPAKLKAYESWAKRNGYQLAKEFIEFPPAPLQLIQ